MHSSVSENVRPLRRVEYDRLGDAYARVLRYAQGDAIALAAFPDVCIRVLDVMR